MIAHQRYVFNPHCSYISANPLISRTRFFDIRILGPHKFFVIKRNLLLNLYDPCEHGNDSISNALISNKLHVSIVVGWGLSPPYQLLARYKKTHRSSEGGDKPHPYGGGVLQEAYSQ